MVLIAMECVDVMFQGQQETSVAFVEVHLPCQGFVPYLFVPDYSCELPSCFVVLFERKIGFKMAVEVIMEILDFDVLLELVRVAHGVLIFSGFQHQRTLYKRIAFCFSGEGGKRGDGQVFECYGLKTRGV